MGFQTVWIVPEIENFPLTPFFNLDAVAIELLPQLDKSVAYMSVASFGGIQKQTMTLTSSEPFP